MSSLETLDLSFAYGDQAILKDVSLEVRSGEVLVLLGANGSGKTTLLRSLCRQLQPDTGAVLIDKIDIRSLDTRSLARNIAMMPQQENRDAPLRVVDVVCLGRMPHVGWWMPLSSNDYQIVTESLEATGLTKLKDRRITELSGGEWRRMMLARALVQQASILLLDEPTAGLDLKYQIDVLTRTRDMTRQCRLAVVMTLHDLNQAATFADRIAVLHDRKLMIVGTPREVLTSVTIQTAFGVSVTVVDHPIHGTPLVITD
jgi:iron complex transport system ATP-binding protein